MADSPARMPQGALAWAAVVVLFIGSALTVSDPALRVGILRAILILSALGETLGGFFQVFRARHMSGQTGRPYAAAYHGVVQDFGFYNFAFALLFALAALDPAGSRIAIGVGIALYGVHGATHLLRYFGLYYGGETRVPTRAPGIELRDGMPLIAAGTGLLLFFP